MIEDRGCFRGTVRSEQKINQFSKGYADLLIARERSLSLVRSACTATISPMTVSTADDSRNSIMERPVAGSILEEACRQTNIKQ